MLRAILLMIVLCAGSGESLAAAAAPADGWNRETTPLRADTRTSSFTMRSDAMGEAREIVVRTPAGYGKGDERYPVIYITDADWNFPVMAEYLEYLAYWNRIPPMIIVGILNVDRNRDFVPRADPNFPNTGEANRFVGFLGQELQPRIERDFRTSGFDIMAGHSFGGVIALHTLFSEPDLFDAYVTVGTSTWVADRALFEEAEAALARGEGLEKFVYMSVAEADGGATVPDGKAFAELMAARKPEGMEWHFDVIPQTNHFTAVVPSLHDALEKLYPAWGHDDEVIARARAGGAEGVEAWFAEKRAALGTRFYPQSMELGVAAYRLAQEGHGEGARALSARLRELYPDRPGVYEASAFVAFTLGDRQGARDLIRQAIAVAERIGYYPNRITMFRSFLARLEAQGTD